MDILEKMLEDPDMMPRALPFHLIQDITNEFSFDNKIGNGGCGEVYKGILQSGEMIAVKKLNPGQGRNYAFIDEFRNLMSVKHQNIVRFIGYCDQSINEHKKTEGQLQTVQCRERLLCFEYLHKGSLDNYLSDESHRLDWDARYKIIRGVCKGLKYLHEIPMYHLDLKPANILLDKYMVPKIADFGLSRLCGRNVHTLYTENAPGTIGYMPPECASSTCIITDKVDIYSLGVIIMQIMVGYKDYPKRNEMPPQEFEKLVMNKLFNMLNASTFQNTALFEVYSEQGRKCFETALQCTDSNRNNRPTIHDVLHMLDETDNMIQRVMELVRHNTIEIVDIHPTELQFPFKENASSYCPLHITNKTDCFVGYFVVVKNPERYQIINNGSRGVVVPRSTSILIVEMREQQLQLQRIGLEIDEFDILVISMESQQGLIHAMYETIVSKEIKEPDLFQRVRGKKGKVHGWVTLMAVIGTQETRKYELTEDKNNINYDGTTFWNRRFICVHPTKRWMLAIDNSGDLIVWEHEAKKNFILAPFREEFKLDVTKPRLLYSWLSMLGLPYGKVMVTSAKFFVQRPWIVCGDERGDIHVWNFLERIKVKQFGAHQAKITSLAVHPTQSLVLSSCQDGIIKLWDCENWMCTRQFATSSGEWCDNLTFNPNDNATFAAGFVTSTVKVWNIHSDSPSCTLPVSRFDSTSPFVYGDRPHLVTREKDKMHIWDWQTGRCIKELTLIKDINTVACHPSLPIIVAGLPGRIITILNAITFRFEYIDSLLVYPLPILGSISSEILAAVARNHGVDYQSVYSIRELGFINPSGGLASLVVRCKYGISLITFEAPAMSQYVDSI